MAAAVAALVLGACSTNGDQGATPAATSTTDPTPATGDPRSGVGRCSGFESPTAPAYVAAAEDGVPLRTVPRADGEVLSTLAPGTDVDALLDVGGCAVSEDGTVWWRVGTSDVPGGGWVDSRGLDSFDDDAPPPGTG